MEQPQIAGTILGDMGRWKEGDDKFTAIAPYESGRSMTDDKQADQLSAFSEVRPRKKYEGCVWNEATVQQPSYPAEKPP